MRKKARKDRNICISIWRFPVLSFACQGRFTFFSISIGKLFFLRICQFPCNAMPDMLGKVHLYLIHFSFSASSRFFRDSFSFLRRLQYLSVLIAEYFGCKRVHCSEKTLTVRFLFGFRSSKNLAEFYRNIYRNLANLYILHFQEIRQFPDERSYKGAAWEDFLVSSLYGVVFWEVIVLLCLDVALLKIRWF